MKQFSVPMALVDYIPVVLFLLAAIKIKRNLKNRVNVVFFYMFTLGAGLIIAAGILKASYKLLYALNLGDYTWMSAQFFPSQSLGFLLAGLGLILAVLKPSNNKVYGIPTMALVGIMVLGLGAMDAGLCFIANKMKKRNALVMFIVSFFLSLMMGYLSSRDFDKAIMNWIAEVVNLCGQLLLYLGVKTLDEAGMKDYI